MGYINFFCDLSKKGRPFKHYWEHTVGSGHAPLALRADWQKQLKQCHDELGFRHVRFHGILSYPMDTLIVHSGEFLYSFFNADRIFDYLLEIGMKPFVELSFMPLALASGGKTVFHYQSNVTPPKDYRKWAELIEKFVSHLTDRYGVKEVREWFFEVWNEPNLKHFWTGTRDDYFKLYRQTAEAIKKIDRSLKVGGPATAQNEWIEEFLSFCRDNDLPADFVSTHHYPTDAFGETGDDTVEQLSKGRDSILLEMAQDAKRRAGDLPLFYTEWNTSSNPRDALHDEPYSAAFVTKTLMEAEGLLEGYSFWTFTDIFEENYFPSQPFHGGFGLMNIHGIPKPAYRAYQLMHGLGDEILWVDGMHSTVKAWIIRKKHLLTVLLINHALPLHPIGAEKVNIDLRNAPKHRGVFIERIDDNHCNPKKTWQKMGEPEYLNASQVEKLKAVSEIKREKLGAARKDGNLLLEVSMPPHSVAAVSVEFENEN